MNPLLSVLLPIFVICLPSRSTTPRVKGTGFTNLERTSRGVSKSLRSLGLRQHAVIRKAKNRLVMRCEKTDGELENVKIQREECYGCGAQIQTQDSRAAGYVILERYKLKKMHKQKNQMLCARCQELVQGKPVPGVRDLWARKLDQEQQPLSSNHVNTRQEGARGDEVLYVTNIEGTSQRLLVSPEQLRQKLATLKSKRSSIMVLVVDMLDSSGSFLGRLRNLVGKNPVVLIGTKLDLLPLAGGINAPKTNKGSVESLHMRENTQEQHLIDWLNSTAIHKGIRPIAVQVVSSKSGFGVREAARKILSERKKRDVYIIGAANVGKSAFVKSLVKEMSDFSSRAFDPAALNQGRFLPVESSVPGTTLGIIALKAFESGGTLYDTPGVHLHHRLQHMLTPKEVSELHPRRKLSVYVAESPGTGGVTYNWGSLAKLDVLECPEGTEIVFFGPKCLKVSYSEIIDKSESKVMKSNNVDDIFGHSSVQNRGGIRPMREYQQFIHFEDFESNTQDLDARHYAEGVYDREETTLNAVVEVAVSGILGWIGVYAPKNAQARLRIQAHAPVGAEVFYRPPMISEFPRRKGKKSKENT